MGIQSDEEIIRSVLNGNVQDFRHLVKRHMMTAYRTAFAVIRNHEDAEEVVQDAFMKVFAALGTFQGKAKFSTWLFRIVYNSALNHVARPYKKTIGLDYVSDAPLEEDWNKLINKDQAFYIGKVLDQLSPEDRMALSLYYLDEKPQQEISVLTGWSLASTKQRIHRARARFDQVLEKILATEKDNLL